MLCTCFINVNPPISSSTLVDSVNNFSAASEILQVPTTMHRMRKYVRMSGDAFDSSDHLGFLELGMVFSSIIVPMRDILFSQRLVQRNIYGRVP